MAQAIAVAAPVSTSLESMEKPPFWWSFWFRLVTMYTLMQGSQEGGGGPYWPPGIFFRWYMWLFQKMQSGSGWDQGAYILSRGGMALIITIVWLAVDFRRKHERESFEIGWMLSRLTLAQLLLGMGLIKIFPLQMLPPARHLMMLPFGDMGWGIRTWHLIAGSTSYQFFTGFVECSAALTLVFRSTALLGSILALFCLTTITLISGTSLNPLNDHYFSMSGVPVWGAIGIFTFVMIPISKFFVFNRSVSLSGQPDRRWLRITERICQVAYVGAGIHGVGQGLIMPTWPEKARTAPVAGVYEVVDFKSTDTTAARAWMWVAIEDRFSTRIGVRAMDCYTVAIRAVNDTVATYSDFSLGSWDNYSPNHRNCVADMQKPEGTLHGDRRESHQDFMRSGEGGPLTMNYRRTSPDELEITATVDKDTVHAHLRRIPMILRSDE